MSRHGGFSTNITGVGDIGDDVVSFNVCLYVCHWAFLSTHLAYSCSPCGVSYSEHIFTHLHHRLDLLIQLLDISADHDWHFPRQSKENQWWPQVHLLWPHSCISMGVGACFSSGARWKRDWTGSSQDNLMCLNLCTILTSQGHIRKFLVISKSSKSWV